MNGEGQNLEFLDILVILSFAMQMQNQSKLVDMPGIRRVVDEIHGHLEDQDKKIDSILEALKNEAQDQIL